MAESITCSQMFIMVILTLSYHKFARASASGEIELRIQMREETTPFTRIGTVMPSLPTNIGTQLHFLTDSTFFTVTPTTGEIMVSRLIDRERLCPEFKLCCGVVVCELKASIFVTDKAVGEFAASVALKVEVQDQNDNRPIFSTPNQTVSLSEASPVGSFVTLQPAKDADIDPENQIQRYTLVEPTGTFKLDVSGLPTIRLELSRAIDREETAEYRATLEACDPGACVRQTVEIKILDENDNSPVLTNNKFTRRLIENTAVGTVVLKLTATDPDSEERGKVLYNFKGNVDSDLSETFELVRDTGEIRLKRPLAANIRDSYEFKVIVCDSVNRVCGGDENSTAEIVFMVQDVNNYPPSIHAVAAGAATSVEVSANTGAGMDLVGTGREPTEQDQKFGGSLSILENSLPSQIAVLTVRDEDTGDNAKVSCSLNNTGEHVFNGEKRHGQDFLLNPSAPGIYSLRTAREFDFEMESTIRTTVVCHDFGKPHQLTSARVITVQVVDVNEFQPEFSRRVYVGRVPENAPAGLEILTTTAIDRDRAAILHYKFAFPPPQSEELEHDMRTSINDDLSNIGVNQYFVIEQETGIIRTSQISLDREAVDSVTLVILATDSILPPVFTATTTVSIEILDENDNAPIFVNPPSKMSELTKEDPNLNAFNIMENAPRFTQLSQKLEARDPDQGDNGRVHFSLLGTFALTRTTRRNQFLASTHNKNNLAIPDKTLDEFPMHYFNEPGLTRHAVEQPIFRITPSGAIETLVELDRETIPFYLLKIGVQDRGAQPLASTAMLRVNVIDANDNAPIWLFPTPMDRTVNLSTSMKPGSLAARLRAEDADSADAGRVEYLFLGPRGEFIEPVSLEDGLLNDISPPNSRINKVNKQTYSSLQNKPGDLKGYRVGPLYLNSSTGEIWVAQSLTPSTINLHLRTQDYGTPRSHTDAWLTINIFMDPNEGIGFLSLGGDGTLNVTIILAMITVTAIISLFLIIGIVCVRRRPTRYSTPRNFNEPHNNINNINNTSSVNGTIPYAIDINKDGIQSNMNSVVWPTSMGVYSTNPYLQGQMTNGGGIFDDGQMFTAIHGPGGVMGYGTVVATSDTGSMIYLPQTPAPPSVMGSIGGSLTPIPVDLSPNGQEYAARNQMHTFGTLTKNRGPVNTALFAGTGGCTIAYEPHLDADSGDSGRGPSEESTQFLLNDNYRNGIATAHNIYQYGNYPSYRPPSRVGYYRTNVNIDNGSLKGSRVPNCQHAAANGPCGCYMVADSTQLYSVNQYNACTDNNDNVVVPVSYQASEFQLQNQHDLEHQILLQNSHDQSTLPPRSPHLNSDSLALHSDYAVNIGLQPNVLQAPNNPSQFYQLSDSSNLTSTFKHQHGLSQISDDSNQSVIDMQTPLKLDLRGQQIKSDEPPTDGKIQNSTSKNTTIKPGLPPLAVKSVTKLSKTNDS